MDSTIKEDIEKANMDIQSLNLLTEEVFRMMQTACSLIPRPQIFQKMKRLLLLIILKMAERR